MQNPQRRHRSASPKRKEALLRSPVTVPRLVGRSPEAGFRTTLASIPSFLFPLLRASVHRRGRHPKLTPTTFDRSKEEKDSGAQPKKRSVHDMVQRVLLLTIFSALTASQQAQKPEKTTCPEGVVKRGQNVMSFSHETTIHHFRLFKDGGEIAVTANDPKDKFSVDRFGRASHISPKCSPLGTFV